MSGYRPLTDVWILARAKLTGGHKYWGAFPGGFPERARVLLGASLETPVLHVCGGKARHYPYAGGIGPNDKTLDLDASLSPDFHQDARERWPLNWSEWAKDGCPGILSRELWRHILIDPPYSTDDAAKYAVGADVYPTPHQLLKRAVEVLAPGGRVGILHYLWPQPVEGLKNIAVITVLVGFNNRARLFSVYERVSRQAVPGDAKVVVPPAGQLAGDFSA